MKSFLSLLFISSMLFISCKKEVETKNSNNPAYVVPFTEAGKQTQTQTPVTQNPVIVNPVIVNSGNTSAKAIATGMNPAHGQPGHRCDIAVGAPLNSPLATTANKPATEQVITQQSQPVSAATTTVTPAAIDAAPTPAGMNPPHGQTNHRCDIAVGAPLQQ